MQTAVSKIGSRRECFEQILLPLCPGDVDETGCEMPVRNPLGLRLLASPLVTLLEESV